MGKRQQAVYTTLASTKRSTIRNRDLPIVSRRKQLHCIAEVNDTLPSITLDHNLFPVYLHG